MKLKLSLGMLVLFVTVFSSLAAHAVAGAVYAETNSNQNAILIFIRAEDGHLFSARTRAVLTGGRGTGVGLGSQAALAIDESNRFLFAVNAGSDNISTFRITEQGLSLMDVTSSNGSKPISLTVNHNILYVLNDGGALGGSDTVAGFSVDDGGHLTPIVSGLHLSAPSVAPEE